MTEEADRFTLTTGPDGRALLTLALRRHPRVSADGFVRAQRYWACIPAGAQPRWLALGGRPGAPQRAEDVHEVTDVHAEAEAYLPGVACSGCGDRWWKPMNRHVVTRYVLTGMTGGCLKCHRPPAEPVVVATPAPEPEPVAPAPADFGPPQVVEARILPVFSVQVEGAAAAMLWSATGGNPQMMSLLVTDLVSRNFGIRRPGHATL
ncbi:hypothetical protein [Actinoplanes sp. HUAS TT8]|uniref:hypothetical protein n=1 Tax=Actinoplanes sp. HUAS TT8 TaxID=3447453 RepID=UPI003F51D4A0